MVSLPDHSACLAAQRLAGWYLVSDSGAEQQFALAFIYYTGGHVDSVQLLVANLCFVLTISAGLHYLGYFREALQHNHTAPALWLCG